MNIVEDFKNFLASFTGLTAKLEKVAADLGSALQTISAKDGEIAQLKSEKVELEAKFAGLPTQEAFDAEKLRADTAEAQVAKLPELANAKAAEIIAANGHQQVNTVTGSDSSNQKTISKAEFDQLTPRQKSEFSKAKGRIVG